MTYSIVARCPLTGELGVAVQSAFVAVGNRVPWARAGVGAVATQAVGNIDFGPEGLELLDCGVPASEAVERLLNADPERDTRQLALVSAGGDVAAFTGQHCVDYAGQMVLDGAVVVANLMTAPGVPEAMADSWDRSTGMPLWSRLLDALDAAESAGGDLRGRQAASLTVVSGERDEKWWQNRLYDIRVDDHLDPLTELRRLVDVQRAFVLSNEGERLMNEGRHDEALQRLNQAIALAPNHGALTYRKAEVLADSDPEISQAVFVDLTSRDPRWEDYRRRMEQLRQS